MKPFKDSAGRTWALSVNYTSIKRVKALTGVDLLTIIGGKLIEQLVADPIKLIDVVYAAIKPDADAAGVSDEQFGEAMAGDAIDHAGSALFDDLIDFFRSGQRTALRAALAKVREAEEISLKTAMKKIQAIDPQKLVDSLSEAPDQSWTDLKDAGGSSTSLPASSGFPPRA